METGAEQNTDLENVFSQSFPKWFSDSYLYYTVFLLKRATAVCHCLFVLNPTFFEKQVLVNFSIPVMMALKQYFYYFQNDFLNQDDFTLKKNQPKPDLSQIFLHRNKNTCSATSVSETWAVAVSATFSTAFMGSCCIRVWKCLHLKQSKDLYKRPVMIQS